MDAVWQMCSALSTIINGAATSARLTHKEMLRTGRSATHGLHIDHDHRGIDGDKACVRGALCNRCNSGLVFLGDTLASWQNIIDAILPYLGDPSSCTYLEDFKHPN